MPRLQIDSLHNPLNAKSRARAALAQLKTERERTLATLRRECEATSSRMQHDLEYVELNGGQFLGSYGSQVDVSKFNSVSGVMYALDLALDLLRQVVEGVDE